MKKPKQDHTIGMELLAAKGIRPGPRGRKRINAGEPRRICPDRPSRGKKL